MKGVANWQRQSENPKRDSSVHRSFPCFSKLTLNVLDHQEVETRQRNEPAATVNTSAVDKWTAQCCSLIKQVCIRDCYQCYGLHQFNHTFQKCGDHTLDSLRKNDPTHRFQIIHSIARAASHCPRSIETIPPRNTSAKKARIESKKSPKKPERDPSQFEGINKAKKNQNSWTMGGVVRKTIKIPTGTLSHTYWA